MTKIPNNPNFPTLWIVYFINEDNVDSVRTAIHQSQATAEKHLVKWFQEEYKASYPEVEWKVANYEDVVNFIDNLELYVWYGIEKAKVLP